MYGNEWYIYMNFGGTEPLYWSSYLGRFTALVFRASYYKTEGHAKRVLKKLIEKNPGDDIRIGRIGA